MFQQIYFLSVLILKTCEEICLPSVASEASGGRLLNVNRLGGFLYVFFFLSRTFCPRTCFENTLSKDDMFNTLKNTIKVL